MHYNPHKILVLTLLVLTLSPSTSRAGEVAKTATEKKHLASIKPYGDIRIRNAFDARTEVGQNTEKRTRPRVRARIGIKAMTSVKGLSLDIRMSSNPSNPGNSAHETFDAKIGSKSSGKEYYLDRANLKYTCPVTGLTIIGGKQSYPFWDQSAASWDGDMQAEGFSTNYSYEFAKGQTLKAVGAYFYLSNASWTDGFLQNNAMGSGQLQYTGKFGSTQATLVATQHKYTTFKGGKNEPNGTTLGSKDGDAVYFNDITFHSMSAQVKFKLGGKEMPLKVSLGGDFFHSTADSYVLGDTVTTGTLNDGANMGYVGIIRAKLGAFGARFYHYNIGETSVLFYQNNTFAQDDFQGSAAVKSGGVTGFTGQRFQLDWKVAKDVKIDFQVMRLKGKSDNLLAFAQNPDRVSNRFRLNFNAKF